MSGPPRRVLLFAVCAALATGASGMARSGDGVPVVTLFGDSIAAGYGLAPGEGPASRLQAVLRGLGVEAVVRNAGLPGDTSAGGRVGSKARCARIASSASWSLAAMIDGWAFRRR